MSTRIKICCMASSEEAQYAIQAGADTVGFVCAIPTSPRTIDIGDVAAITSLISRPVSTFLLTSECTAEGIAQQVLVAGVSSVQILSRLSSVEYEKLPKLLPETQFVQVVHVEGDSALELIHQYAPYVHTFLLDSGRPNLPVPEYGGTGRTHDWAVSAEFVKRSPHPVFLAGGLSAVNVGEAIKGVRPFGVDVCSGVRTDNRLDFSKLKLFMEAVRKADAELNMTVSLKPKA